MKRIKLWVKSRFIYIGVELIKEFATSLRSKGDYSETGEFSLILNSLKQVNPLSYIDVGSGKPCTNSNSYNFYKLGFKGILIDPLPRNQLLTKIMRPKDEFYLGVIGSSKNPIVFHRFIPYEYSTTSPIVFEQLLEHKHAKFVQNIPYTPIKISSLQTKMEYPYFISIDIEGSELDALEGVNFLDPGLKLICVEFGAEDVDLSDGSQLNRAMNINEFFEVDRTSKSMIYMRVKVDASHVQSS
jgi:hypothetical protein